MSSIEDTKKCGRKGCRNGKKELPMSYFIKNRGEGYTTNCKDCREQKQKWAEKNKEKVHLSNICKEDRDKYKRLCVEKNLNKPRPSPTHKIERKTIDGKECSWCSSCADYLPISNFGKGSRDGLKHQCRDCINNSESKQTRINKIIECEICGEKIKYKSKYDHMKNKHSNEEDIFNWECETCNLKFKHEKIYKNHLETENHKNTIKATKIVIDSEKLNKKYNEILKKDEDDNLFKCDQCYHKFDEKNKLENHIERCHKEKIFKCKVIVNGIKCKSSFCTEKQYKCHMKRSHPENVYYCSYESCDKKFSRADRRDRHEVEVHNPIKVVCKICQKQMMFRNYNDRHLKLCITKQFLERFNGSSYEKKTAMFLNANNIKYIREVTYEDLKVKSYLPYDFYLPDFNCLIEVQGEQHYDESGRKTKKQDLERIQKYDKIKKDYALSNGYKFIEINAKENKTYELIAKVLSTELDIENPIIELPDVKNYIKIYKSGDEIPEFQVNQKINILKETLPEGIANKIKYYMNNIQ
tara:strand:- start:4248 stop:5822 length:1575 start_codon:yes stop_codon:yes gene_type:complete